MASCTFDSIHGAVQTAIETIQLGMPVARMELMDDLLVDAINRFSKTQYPVAPTLLFEFHGDTVRNVTEQAETVQALAQAQGGKRFPVVHNVLKKREKLWKSRHDVHWASIALRAGSKTMATDTCVPISRLAECIVDAKKRISALPFPSTIVGHVGDGNFHIVFVIDPNNSGGIKNPSDCDGGSAHPRARLRWAAPAPASMALAREGKSICRKNTARLLQRTLQSHQARVRSRE